MKLCTVAWCAAFATHGDHCPVHAKHPSVRPECLAADETFCAEMAECEACSGSGECDTCSGTGECEAFSDCPECGSHRGHECGKCDGDGECRACAGEGRVTHKKREATA